MKKTFLLTTMCAALMSVGMAHANHSAVKPTQATMTAAQVAGALQVNTAAGKLQFKAEADTLSHLVPNSLLTVSVNGQSHYLVVEHRTAEVDGVWHLTAHASGDMNQRVTLKSDNHVLTGSILLDKDRFSIGQVNGVSVIAKEGANYMPAANQSAAPLIAKAEPFTSKNPTSYGANRADKAYQVDINAAELLAMKPNTEVNLNLPGLKDTTVVFERAEGSGTGTMNWVGYLRDSGNSYRVNLTFDGDNQAGTISTPHGDYDLSMLDGKTVLTDLAGSGYRPLQTDINDGVEHPAPAGVLGNIGLIAAGAGTTSTSTTKTTAPAPKPVVATATPVAPTVIDLQILTDAGLGVRYGTGLKAKLESYVAIANTAYTDSGVNVRLRLVNTQPVSEPRDTNNSTVLSSSIKKYASIRDAAGADVTVVMREFAWPVQASCGVAYLSGTGLSGATGVAAYKNLAFAVVSEGSSSSYYCRSTTMPHEIGHIMGLHHDRGTLNANNQKGTPAFPYGYGFATSSFGTIMSYSPKVLPKFANPDVACSGTQKCGNPMTSTEPTNTALAMNNVKDVVAGFRPDKTAVRVISGNVTYGTTGPVTGATVVANPGAINCGTTSTAGLFSCSVPLNWTGTIGVNPPNNIPYGVMQKLTPLTIPVTGVTASLRLNYLQGECQYSLKQAKPGSTGISDKGAPTCPATTPAPALKFCNATGCFMSTFK